VLRADIHHPPWPLILAEADFELNTMAEPYGLKLDSAPPLLHFATRQDVLIWPLARARPAARSPGSSSRCVYLERRGIGGGSGTNRQRRVGGHIQVHELRPNARRRLDRFATPVSEL
jgi:hypothetical protein